MDIGLFFKLTVGLVVSALVAWVAGVLLGLATYDFGAVIVLRTLPTLLVVLVVTRALVRRAYESPRLLRTIAVAAVVSYVLWLPSWGARGLFGQTVIDHLGVAYVIDLMVWVGAVLVAARSVEARPSQRSAQPYQAV